LVAALVDHHRRLLIEHHSVAGSDAVCGRVVDLALQ